MERELTRRCEREKLLLGRDSKNPYRSLPVCYKIRLSVCLDPLKRCLRFTSYVFVFFFFFFFTRFGLTRLLFMYCSLNSNRLFHSKQCISVLFMDSQISLFSNFFIKNGSHGTIHTFKNYFATVFSVSEK